MLQEDFIIEDGILTKYNGKGGDIVIPDGVREIGPHAFENCVEVTSLRTGKDLRVIGYLAFSGCPRASGGFKRGHLRTARN